MKFGPVPLDDAQGALLAHSISTPNGKLRKGCQLTSNDVQDLRAAGFDQVVVAQLGRADLHEDAAALALAEQVVPDPAALGLQVVAAGAGRVNLYAQAPGVMQVDANKIAALNAVDPMVTIATVPDCHRVDAGTMVATVKIISYGVAAASISAAGAAAKGALRLCPSVLRSATLIETVVPGQIRSDKGRAAMAGRLERMEAVLTPPVIVPHTEVALAEALSAAEAELVLILTGSATSDAMDVAPNALRLAGGVMERFGMPVDPGNLLFLGHLGGRPVIGLPGCARSPALNGADWVLERVLCGLRVTAADIAAMGVGGLLKEIPTRPRPRRETDAER